MLMSLYSLCWEGDGVAVVIVPGGFTKETLPTSSFSKETLPASTFTEETLPGSSWSPESEIVTVGGVAVTDSAVNVTVVI